MTQHETDTQTRLRRAKEALDAYREKERTALQAAHDARQDTARAKARYEALFHQEEQEEVARRRAEYRHATN